MWKQCIIIIIVNKYGATAILLPSFSCSSTSISQFCFPLPPTSTTIDITIELYTTGIYERFIVVNSGSLT